VKILIEAQLSKTGDNWEDFLVRNHFKEEDIKEPSDKTKKRKRNLTIKENSQEQHSKDENPLAYMLLNLKKKNTIKKANSQE